MAHNRPLKDPAAFLKDLVANKGTSEQHGCVFRGANLAFDPTEQGHSDTYDDTMSLVRDLVPSEKKYRKLVSTLTHFDTVYESYTFSNYFGLKGVSAYIRKSPTEEFTVTFTFPMIDANRFALDIEIVSHISNFWAKISGQECRATRVFIDYAYLRWEDMEEENLLYTEYESN